MVPSGPERQVEGERLMAGLTHEHYIEQLSDFQRGLVEDVRAAKQNRESAMALYGQAIKRAVASGISYGVMSHMIGVPRETLFRIGKRLGTLTVTGK